MTSLQALPTAKLQRFTYKIFFEKDFAHFIFVFAVVVVLSTFDGVISDNKPRSQGSLLTVPLSLGRDGRTLSTRLAETLKLCLG